MSARDGFDEASLSTTVFQDGKVIRLARLHPELFDHAFTAYIAVVAASWRDGSRVPVLDAWPSILRPLDPRAVEALQEVRLVDKRGRIAPRTWASWFEPAATRRELLRERYRRANANRARNTALLPRGNVAVTAPLIRTDTDRREGKGRSTRETKPTQVSSEDFANGILAASSGGFAAELAASKKAGGR